MCTYFKTETNEAQNPIDCFFSNFEGTGQLSEKTEVLDAELSKREEAVTISYSAAVLVAKNMIRSRCSSGIFLHIYFLTILIMVTEWLY